MGFQSLSALSRTSNSNHIENHSHSYSQYENITTLYLIISGTYAGIGIATISATMKEPILVIPGEEYEEAIKKIIYITYYDLSSFLF